MREVKIVIEFNAWHRQHCAVGAVMEKGIQRGETKFCFLSPGYSQMDASTTIAGLTNWLLTDSARQYGQVVKDSFTTDTCAAATQHAQHAHNMLYLCT